MNVVYGAPQLRGLFFGAGRNGSNSGRESHGAKDMSLGGIRDLIEPVIEDMGYELVLVEMTGDSSGGQILRAYIDAPGGILLEDCEQVSKQVSAMLDVEDPIKGEYSLEVSSPGLERPLVKPEHFIRFRGSRVKVLTRTAHLGRRRFTGVADRGWRTDFLRRCGWRRLRVAVFGY